MLCSIIHPELRAAALLSLCANEFGWDNKLFHHDVGLDEAERHRLEDGQEGAAHVVERRKAPVHVFGVRRRVRHAVTVPSLRREAVGRAVEVDRARPRALEARVAERVVIGATPRRARAPGARSVAAAVRPGAVRAEARVVRIQRPVACVRRGPVGRALGPRRLVGRQIKVERPQVVGGRALAAKTD